METVLAAFLGAVVGSIGAVVDREAYRRRADREATRRSTIENYLLQLQDAIESLRYRLDNGRIEPGHEDDGA